jgi:hypothetical protein
MTGDGGLVEVQATAERTPLSRAHLDELLALAAAGIEQLRIKQAQAIAEAKAAPPNTAASSADAGAAGEPSTSEGGAS